MDKLGYGSENCKQVCIFARLVLILQLISRGVEQLIHIETIMSEIFEMVAKTFQGLEGVLSDELTALGAQEVTQGTRMVAFKGDKEMMYRANFALRTALRILKPIYKFHSTDADDLYEQMGAIRPAVSRVTIKPSK